MRALAKAEENGLVSALQHSGTVQGVTKSPRRSAPQLTVGADVSSSVLDTMPTTTQSYLGPLSRHDDRLCHSIRSFSVAVLRRLGAGGSLEQHRTRRPTSLARDSHPKWFFGRDSIVIPWAVATPGEWSRRVSGRLRPDKSRAHGRYSAVIGRLVGQHRDMPRDIASRHNL
jgi:hypothetical protein